MSRILEGLEGVECNIDDVLVHAPIIELHDYRLQKVLERLSEAGVPLNNEHIPSSQGQLPRQC